MKNNFNGFTLLELVIVIIIIGALASLALPKLMMSVWKAYGVEAINQFNVTRQDIFRCCFMVGEIGDLCISCDSYEYLGTIGGNPNKNTARKFDYYIYWKYDAGVRFFVLVARFRQDTESAVVYIMNYDSVQRKVTEYSICGTKKFLGYGSCPVEVVAHCSL